MQSELAVGLLVLIAALAVAAKVLRAPYPVVFVVAGLLLALIPGAPHITLPPDLVFLGVLPLLLFGGGWQTDFREFTIAIRPIVQLAVGFVTFNTLAIAAIAHAIVPQFGWAAAFVLGAITSPPDAVAAEAIAEEVSLPRRILTIASGESLVNDASALVIYRFAVAAAVTGVFSLGAAIGQFAIVAAGGVAVGLAVGWIGTNALIVLRRSGLGDETIDVAISLFTPYVAYLPAEALHVSGVLSAVTAGIFCSRRSEQIFGARSRIVVSAVWDMLFFVLNGGIFVVIGLQLRTILAGLSSYPLPQLALYGVTISLATIVIRIVWMFPAAYLPRLIPAVRRREGERAPPWTWLFVLSWMGMRGIVSLAAALALPLTTASGAPFPGRDLVVFLTFCVIVATLVGQGLTLPLVIRKLGVVEPSDPQRAKGEAQVRVAQAAADVLTELEPRFRSTAEWEVAGRLRTYFEDRVSHLRMHLDGERPDGDIVTAVEAEHRMRRATIEAQRAALGAMRRDGAIGDEVYRDLQHEIDLEEARLG